MDPVFCLCHLRCNVLSDDFGVIFNLALGRLLVADVQVWAV